MKRMKLSQFTIFIEDYPKRGHHLVYNTLSRALIEIDNKCLSMLYSLSKEKEPTADELQGMQKLLAQGFIVPAELDEAGLFNQKFSKKRTKKKELHATILTTFECPMQCVYCYQKEFQDGGDMSKNRVEKTISYLTEKIEKKNYKRCHITFYGGEPLMNFSPIEQIGSRMRDYCSQREKPIYLSMVTSGLLLTPKIAEKLKRIGVRGLQITLDGDRETHNRRRPRKDGSGTFSKILQNLSYLTEDFSVTILCNVDKTNVEGAYKLVDVLVELGFAEKIKRLIFGPVSDASSHIACPNTSEEDLTKLTLYAARMGFADDLRPRHMICGMLLNGNFVIDVEGFIYTCPAFLGKKEYTLFSVNKKEKEGTKNLLSNFSLPPDCLSCPYVPICAGGCRYNALIEQNDMNAISCKKKNFSFSLPHLLKAHYALRD